MIVGGLLLLAAGTALDVLLRYAFASPIRGFVDIASLTGAVLLAAISDVARVITNVQGLSLVIYGTLLVIIIAFLPNGLIALFQRMFKGRPTAARKGGQ